MADTVQGRPRAGWDVAFKLMHELGDARLLICDDVDLDFDQWEWRTLTALTLRIYK